MSKTSIYSPVAAFELHQQPGVLAGFAAPARGLSPCLIRLSADEAPIAFTRATRHDPEAAARGLRHGWCGFEMAGLRQAFAIGDAVRLSCGVSGETLVQIPFDPALFQPQPVTARTLSVHDLTRLVRAGEMCADVDQLLPFALAHHQKYGARAFIEAAHQTLLRRWPDSSDPDLEEIPGASTEETVALYLHSLVEGLEFSSLWLAEIPGPFHDNFRFDRSPLA